MGVPAHDARDGVLAESRGLPVVNVITKATASGSGTSDGDADVDSVMVNSGTFDGLRTKDARKAIGDALKVSACNSVVCAMMLSSLKLTRRFPRRRAVWVKSTPPTH
jgi:leucyl-tRNA synthetase